MNGANEQVAEQPELDELDTWFDEETDDEQASEAATETVAEVDTAPVEEAPSKEVPDDGDDVSPEQGSGEVKAEPYDPYAWINNLPDDFKQDAEALLQEARSSKGRARSFQTQLEEERRRQAAQVAATQAPASTDAGDNGKEFTNEELAALKEEFPELGSRLEKANSQEREYLHRLVNEQLAPLREQAELDRRRAAQTLFDARAAKLFKTDEGGPDYRDVVQTPEFQEYFDNLTPGKQALLRSDDIDEAIDALGDFVDYASRKYAEAQPKAPTQTQQAKQAKLEQNAIPPSKSAPTEGGPPRTSYEEDFDSFID